MTNAAAIPTLNGGGAHGHMALTLTTLAYADISDVPFVIPVTPPANPPPGATQPQITKNNRIHQRDANIYNLYVAVNNALRQQLLDAVPRIYVRALAHPMFAFSNVTCLDFSRTSGPNMVPSSPPSSRKISSPCTPLGTRPS
jgi:hypothetical protein